MDRRRFLLSSGATALGTMIPRAIMAADQPQTASRQDSFEWITPELKFAYELSQGRLRQKSILPAGVVPSETAERSSSGVETAIQCTGENSPDSGMKQAIGQPGERLLFIGKREEINSQGRRLILSHADPVLGILVNSFYQSFEGVPVVRRWTRVTNNGKAPVGIDFLSSAMLHGLADPQAYEDELSFI